MKASPAKDTFRLRELRAACLDAAAMVSDEKLILRACGGVRQSHPAAQPQRARRPITEARLC